MARGFPSMTALLGLLAIAGYQNRDKIAELINGAKNSSVGRGGVAPSSGLRDLLSGLGGAGAGGFLNGGLRELLERFQQNGKGDVAESWVSRGPNKEITPNDLEAAIGPNVLAELGQRTGLSRQELLDRLSRQLPTAVDNYTPEGRIPA